MIIRVMFVAALALAVGVGVYVLDRPSGSAYMLPLSWSLYESGQTFFGSLGGSLPSLLHTFCFSMLSSLALPRTAGWTALACGGWGLLETLLEVGQHPRLAPLLASAIGDRFQQIPVLDHLGRYFTNGVFDSMDVMFGLCGAALAFIVVYLSRFRNMNQRRERRWARRQGSSVARCCSLPDPVRTTRGNALPQGANNAPVTGPPYRLSTPAQFGQGALDHFSRRQL